MNLYNWEKNGLLKTHRLQKACAMLLLLQVGTHPAWKASCGCTRSAAKEMGNESEMITLSGTSCKPPCRACKMEADWYWITGILCWSPDLIIILINHSKQHWQKLQAASPTIQSNTIPTFQMTVMVMLLSNDKMFVNFLLLFDFKNWFASLFDYL